MSVRNGAISVCSSFRMREVRPSGPAALPGFNLESCFAYGYDGHCSEREGHGEEKFYEMA